MYEDKTMEVEVIQNESNDNNLSSNQVETTSVTNSVLTMESMDQKHISKESTFNFLEDSTENNSPKLYFYNVQTGFLIKIPYDKKMLLSHIITSISGKLLIDIDSIFICHRNKILDTWETIEEVLPNVHDGYKLYLNIDPLPSYLQSLESGEEVQYCMKYMSCLSGSNNTGSFIVVTRSIIKRTFMGGFRDKRTGVIYLNSATQIFIPKKRQNNENKITRDTQTHGRTKTCQTQRDGWTQMQRRDLLLSTQFDRVIYAKPYFSAEKVLNIQIQKAIKIQTQFRAWKARRTSEFLKSVKLKREEKLYKEEEERQLIKQLQINKDKNRRTHPRTKDDFQLLYSDIEAWRKQESKLSCENINEQNMHKTQLLLKETCLLKIVSQMETDAKKLHKSNIIKKDLDSITEGKRMQFNSGLSVIVETPFTKRAKELKSLYNSLQSVALMETTDRLNVLSCVKETVREMNCPLTRELTSLIDREIDLIGRNRPHSALHGLRKRIESLFLLFITTPEFNPEAGRIQRVPNEYKDRSLVKLDNKK